MFTAIKKCMISCVFSKNIPLKNKGYYHKDAISCKCVHTLESSQKTEWNSWQSSQGNHWFEKLFILKDGINSYYIIN